MTKETDTHFFETYMTKETYTCGKRGLRISQKREGEREMGGGLRGRR